MKSINISALYLAELGFFPQQNGFGYLAYAISVVMSDPIGYYTGRVDVQPTVARDCGVSVMRVARCMRYALRCAWEQPFNAELRRIFPACGKDYPPPIMEFVCRVAIEIGKTETAPEERDKSFFHTPNGAIDRAS